MRIDKQHKLSFAIILLLISLLLSSVRANIEKLSGKEKIFAEFARGRQKVKVIVGFEMPQHLKNIKSYKDKQFKSQVKAQIAERRSNVLSGLAANEFALSHRYKNFECFAGEVSQAGLTRLLKHPMVKSVELSRIERPMLAQGIGLINGLTVRSSYNGQNVAIAISDTGVDYTHLRLGGGGFPNSKVIGGYDTGDNDSNPIPNGDAHGTACAGIAAGDLGTVGDYIGGVAYNAKIYAMKISYGSGGSAYESDVIQAWDWCIDHQYDDVNNPILIISHSFGGGRYFSSAEAESDRPSYAAAAGRVVAAGITVFAASGNEGYCESMAAPAAFSDVNSIGSVYDTGLGTIGFCVEPESCVAETESQCSPAWACWDSSGADVVSCYSNSASFLDLLAPAHDAYTTDISGSDGYELGDYTPDFGGTSAACPYAAGAAACLQSAAKILTGSYLTPQQVRDTLVNTGDYIIDSKSSIATPRVNLQDAIDSFGLYTISGRVTYQGSGLADVNMTGLGVVTDANGDYSAEVNSGWSGTVTPTKPNYTFDPNNRLYTNVITNTPDQNYIATYTPDLTSPTPDPMTWFVVPTATGSTSISMTATTATDSSGVEYYFDETSGNPGGSDSVWQDSSTYEGTGLVPNTQYTYRVKARDKSAQQNETDWSSPASATTESWFILTYDDFEGGWGNYTDGGGDCSLYTGGTFAHQGSNAANIQDNSGTASSFYHTNGIDVDTPDYIQIEVDFWFYAVSMDNSNEDFWVQYYDGSQWHTVATYARGIDFQNNQFYHKTVYIDESSYTFPTDMKIRFMCDASGNRDDVYIDEVKVSAKGAPAPSVYTISGRVTYQGSGLADVNMTGLGVITDANGDYSTEVDSGWSGTVTPTKPNYIFDPNNRLYTNVITNKPDQNYTATHLIAPVIASIPITLATAGMPYSYDVNANGIPMPNYVLTILPNGMDINSVSGLIEWTPDANQIGDVNVTVEASNIVGTDNQSFTITVLPSDDFNDNRRSAMWRLYVEDINNVWVVGDANRLNLRATNAANDCVALYIANGWAFDANQNFSVEVDFHYGTLSSRDGWIGLIMQSADDYVSISAGSDGNEPYFYYETIVDGNTVVEQELRDSNDGTLYISYDADSNNVYLSHFGYGIGGAYTWQSPGATQKQWASNVDVSIGGGSDRVALGTGDAYLDNLGLTSGRLIGWPPVTDLDSDGFIGWGDLGIMSKYWLGDPNTDPNVQGDLNHDNIVNFLDFAEFGLVW